MSKKITVLGGGSWGTAFSTLLAANNHHVSLWCFEDDVVESITKTRINKTYLPGITLDEKIVPTASLFGALDGAEFIVEAIPVPFLRETLEEAKAYVSPETPWVCLSKGIEAESLLFSSQIVVDVLGVLDDNVVVVGGPNFANQVAQQVYSGMLVASKNKRLRKSVAALCANFYCKPYCSADIMGAQVGGALKNVITLFLGILQGAGFQENMIAFLLTRGFLEMRMLAKVCGGDPETMSGLAGFGDLILGLVGKKNRNYEIGILFGQGKTLAELAATKRVLPEGVNTIKSVHLMAKHGNFDLPVCNAAYEFVYEKKSLQYFIDHLMAGEVGDE